MPFARLSCHICIAMLVFSMVGCMGSGVHWQPPKIPFPEPQPEPNQPDFDYAEHIYEMAIEKEEDCCACCVDLFFEAAVETLNCAAGTCRKRELHDACLVKLVCAGQRFKRFDPSGSLRVHIDGQPVSIPVGHHGFVWRPDQFHELVPVGDYVTESMSKLYRRPGVGIPLVVMRNSRPGDDAFLADVSHFAATLRLSHDHSEIADTDHSGLRLEFHDPLRVDRVDIDGQSVPLRKDISAPLAYSLRDEPRPYLNNFINPQSNGVEAKLYSIEPYQSGKIPIVFVHGLLSDPYTWIEMINELRARPGLIDRFQLWVFEYPTGEAFLSSAAVLRQSLMEARSQYDPLDQDRQLCNMVIVGHSMGGLVAKLQVSHSGDDLWRSVANRPIDAVTAREELREDLRKSFFFHPSQCVSRVVYIATPHRGSNYSRRLVGKIGKLLVTQSDQRKQEHRELIDSNPGVFADEVSRRIPTSIDVLDPDSRVLKAILRLPVNPRVRLHSVIAESKFALSCEPSDGIVAVSSARLPDTLTERLVKGNHSDANKNPDAVEELICILNRQLAESEDSVIQQAVGQIAVGKILLSPAETRHSLLRRELGFHSEKVRKLEQQSLSQGQSGPLLQHATCDFGFIRDQTINTVADHTGHGNRIVDSPNHHLSFDRMSATHERVIHCGGVDCQEIDIDG